MLLKNKSNHNQKGGVLVEFALILPLFLLLLFAMIDFAWLMHIRASMAAAAREGARELAVAGSSVTSAQTTVSDYLSGMNLNPSLFTINGTDPDTACTTPPVDVSMTVVLTSTDAATLAGDPFGVISGSMTVSVTMRKECP